jgi:hypothetical protein
MSASVTRFPAGFLGPIVSGAALIRFIPIVPEHVRPSVRHKTPLSGQILELPPLVWIWQLASSQF